MSYLVHEEQETTPHDQAAAEERTPSVRLAKARRRMDRLDVLHLVAHAKSEHKDAKLAFTTSDGTITWRRANQVAIDVSGDRRGPLPGLVLLQLDETDADETPTLVAVAHAFAAQCPNVVAVQHRGDQRVLSLYLETLYLQIAAGRPIDEALDAALERSMDALDADDERDRRCPPFGIPVVYLAKPDVLVPSAPVGSESPAPDKPSKSGSRRTSSGSTLPASPPSDEEFVDRGRL